jgi:hypothetical protein
MNKLTTLCVASLAAGLFSVSVLAQTPAAPAKAAAPAATAAAPAKAATPAAPAAGADAKKPPMKDCSTAKDPGRCEARHKAFEACKNTKPGPERHECLKAQRPAKPAAKS